MTNTTKLVRLALPAAVVAVGIAGAVLLGGLHDRPTVTIPSDVTLIAALDQAISTERSRVGDHITLHTVEPIRLDAETQLSEGVTLHGEVTHVKGGGRIAGAPELDLRITELEVDGRTYLVSTEPFHVEGKSDAKLTLAAGEHLRIRLTHPIEVQVRTRAEAENQ